MIANDIFEKMYSIEGFEKVGIMVVDFEGNIFYINEYLKSVLKTKASDMSAEKLSPEIDWKNILFPGRQRYNNKLVLGKRNMTCTFSKIGLEENYTVGIFAEINENNKWISQTSKFEKTEKQFDAVLDSLYDGIYIADDKGYTVKVNSAYEKITGIQSGELLGKHLNELVDKGFFSKSVSIEVIKKKEPVTIIQKLRNGKEIMCTGNPVLDEKKNVSMVVTNVRDITELMKLQRDLIKNEALNRKYSQELRKKYPEDIVVNSRKMADVLDYAKQVAPFPTPILVTGLSGVGKEVVVSFIHNNSKRKKMPFVKINCGAIPENLLESELFGYEGGAFTGAKKQGKPGLFEMADEGTIFLDEIAELPYNLQVKLLRTIQEGSIMRIGGVEPKKINVRIISATNRNLKEMVGENRFRRDLYYRLNVIEIGVPSLKERKADILSIADYYLQKYCENYGLYKTFTPEVKECFLYYDWPGNIRELKNLVENLVVSSKSIKIEKEHLPKYMLRKEKDGNTIHSSGLGEIVGMNEALVEYEIRLIKEALEIKKTVRGAAKLLGVHHSTLSRKISKHGIKI